MKYIIEITSGRTPINLTPAEAYDVFSVAVPFAQGETVESLKELAKQKGLRAEVACWLHRKDGSVLVSACEPLEAVRAFLEASPDDVQRVV